MKFFFKRAFIIDFDPSSVVRSHADMFFRFQKKFPVFDIFFKLFIRSERVMIHTDFIKLFYLVIFFKKIFITVRDMPGFMI